MTNIRCLIVDDEPIARQIVQRYCEHLPELEIVATCSDALDARQVLMKENIDLMFLDIDMPMLDGMAFMKTLKYPPQVIFTTAYKEFALEAFDLAACDYLLKPFSLDRFLVAVDKAKDQLSGSASKTSNENLPAFVYVKSDGKIHKIVFDELLYGEAKGNNVLIVTEAEQIVTTMTFANFEGLLPVDSFLRIHRSFIINKNKINHIYGNRVFIGASEIPIGSKYKELFFRNIGIKQ